eukprot:gene5816-biopygen11784
MQGTYRQQQRIRTYQVTIPPLRSTLIRTKLCVFYIAWAQGGPEAPVDCRQAFLAHAGDDAVRQRAPELGAPDDCGSERQIVGSELLLHTPLSVTKARACNGSV